MAEVIILAISIPLLIVWILSLRKTEQLEDEGTYEQVLCVFLCPRGAGIQSNARQ